MSKQHPGVPHLTSAQHLLDFDQVQITQDTFPFAPKREMFL
jgi:hypothetical protein